MSEIVKRSLAGAALIALALVAAAKGGTWFAVLVALAACVMFYEWRRIVRGWGLGWQVAGFLYALVPSLALLYVRESSGSPGAGVTGLELLLWVFIVTWSVDIGAYFAGRAIGGPRLAPRISPNKTWAGLIGGVIAAALMGGAWAHFTKLPAAILALAPLFGVAAQGGDLFESWLKRRSGIKDSGSWLPGHGGALDRLDGLVVVATLTAAAVLAGLL